MAVFRRCKLATMARNEYTADKIESLARELTESSEALMSLAKSMREAGTPHVLIHGTTAENFHMPAVIEWVGKTTADARTQIRAYIAGIQSRAEFNKKHNENQKLAAAAKKPGKKTTKKKPA